MTAPLVVESPSRRLPASVAGSIGLHAAAIGILMYAAHSTQHEAARVIGNVDLMIQVHKPLAFPQAAPKVATPASTWNFLKMALPAAPKLALQQLSAPLPEHHALMPAQAKLQDKGRLDAAPKLNALDMSAKAPSLEKLDVDVDAKHSVKALASLPKLEEVGRRKVRNLPQALALDEQRQQALQLQQMDALSTVSEHHLAPAQGQPLQDAAPTLSRSAAAISAILPHESGLDMSQRMMQAPSGTFPKTEIAEIPSKPKSAQAMGADKKGVSIEGPLRDRNVTSYDIPAFPKWARDQGLLEADVAIHFWVSPEGDVLPDMRVETTSGYGQLDRLAMQSLKNWKFVPLSSSDEKQWGVITFRFILE